MRGTLSPETPRRLIRPMAGTHSRPMWRVHIFGNQCDALLTDLCGDPGRQQLCRARWPDNPETRRFEASAAQCDNFRQNETEMNSDRSREQEKPQKRDRHTQDRGGGQVLGRRRLRQSAPAEQELRPNLQPEKGRNKRPARKQSCPKLPERCPGLGIRLGRHNKKVNATRQTATHHECATLHACRIFARHPWRGAGFRKISKAAAPNGDNRRSDATLRAASMIKRCRAVHPAGWAHRGHSQLRS